MKRIEDYIISVPDFPKPGILFRDITGILNDADGLKLTLDALYKALENMEFDLVAGLEARGFLFGVSLAEHFHKSWRSRSSMSRPPAPSFLLIPIRKSIRLTSRMFRSSI